jgi:hypothetical protein
VAQPLDPCTDVGLRRSRRQMRGGFVDLVHE